MRYVAISPDGNKLVSSGWDPSFLIIASIQSWNINPLSLEWNKQFSQISPKLLAFETLAFSPDGKIVAIGDWAAGITMIDASTGQLKLSIELEGKSTTGVRAMEFCPTGEFLAVSTQTSRTHILAAENGVVRATLEGSRRVWNLAFNPDGDLLVIASGGAAHLFDVNSGKLIRSYSTKPKLSGKTDDLDGEVWRVAFSPDGKQLATATTDFIQVWDVNTGSELRETEAGHSRPGALTFSKDGTQIGWANWNDEIWLWSFLNSEKAHKVKVLSHMGRAIFRPDFKLAYVSEYVTSMSIIELPTGRVLNRIVCTDFIRGEPGN